MRAGVEVRSTGDLALSNDWNLATRPAGEEPGMLTLRAAGNLNLDNHLSDGFNVATPFSSGTTPATLVEGDSWGYRLVAGADADAADPLAVKAGSGDITLAAGKLVRTGTGDIHLAAGGDIKLADNKSAIYTAGRIADTAAGFVVPANAQFSQGGGDVSLVAMGDITGSPSAQLYSNWLFRQGAAGCIHRGVYPPTCLVGALRPVPARGRRVGRGQCYAAGWRQRGKCFRQRPNPGTHDRYCAGCD